MRKWRPKVREMGSPEAQEGKGHEKGDKQTPRDQGMYLQGQGESAESRLGGQRCQKCEKMRKCIGKTTHPRPQRGRGGPWRAHRVRRGPRRAAGCQKCDQKREGGARVVRTWG